MEKAISPSKIGIRYGVILGIIFVIYGIVIQVLDLDMKVLQYLGYLNYVFLIVFIVLACKEFKKENGGYMSMGEGLGIGTLLSFVSGLLSSICSYLYIKFIDDSLIQKVKDMQIAEMEKQDMSEEQIEKAMEIAGKFMGAGMMSIMSLIAILFFGFVLSLIIAAILKKNRTELNTLDAG